MPKSLWLRLLFLFLRETRSRLSSRIDRVNRLSAARSLDGSLDCRIFLNGFPCSLNLADDKTCARKSVFRNP